MKLVFQLQADDRKNETATTLIEYADDFKIKQSLDQCRIQKELSTFTNAS